MRTIGLIDRVDLMQTEPCHTLVVGLPGRGKSHLALKMAIADHQAGYAVTYISTQDDWHGRFLGHYLQDGFRCLEPDQIDVSTLNCDTTLAGELFPGERPTLSLNNPLPVVAPDAFTLINLGWGFLVSNPLRYFLVGCLLQHIASLPMPVSVYVDDLNLFGDEPDHPIFQALLSNPAKLTTFIVQYLPEFAIDEKHREVFNKFPLKVAVCTSRRPTAQVVCDLFGDDRFTPSSFAYLKMYQALVSYQSEAYCVEFPQDNVTL
ncbi:MAG: hypothetical protein KF770_23665 [Anaerolineae bacterium]|nr:hypothetical protein [Anaerolineae bacterium]